MKYVTISFFSGAMGLDLGLEKAGFDIRLALDNDPLACETIRLNRPVQRIIEGNLENYTHEEILTKAQISSKSVFLMCGGPPCQAFSSAGKRRGFNDGRGNVFLHFIDLILKIRPKYYLIENVRGLLSAPLNHVPHKDRGVNYRPSQNEKRGGALIHIIQQLKSGGYSVSFNLYNSANYGVPESRERVIILGSRDGAEIPFIPPTHSKEGENEFSKWVSFRSAVKGLKYEGMTATRFPDRRLRFFKMLKAGQNWKCLPQEHIKEAMGNSYYAGGGKTGFFRRLAWDSPSPTLVTCPTMPATDLAHPEEDRPLSLEEYKRIQQFPDNWKFAGKLLDIYRQIGNAVPIGLGHAVGKHIIWFDKLCKSQKYSVASEQKQYKYSRYKNTDHNYYMSIIDKSEQLTFI